jgi:hypothetical protein
VTLGSISLAGGYLFVQAPTLLLPSPTGPGNIFIDYLPTDPTAALKLNLVSPPTGITTLVFGGTPETGSIFIGNGTQTFALQSNTNLVFDTSGTTYYPDAISSNGQVLVLGGDIVLASSNISPATIDTVPLTPTDYTTDQPPAEGVLGYPADPGNINSDGVDGANQGLIDKKTSQQPALSCGTGGT